MIPITEERGAGKGSRHTEDVPQAYKGDGAPGLLRIDVSDYDSGEDCRQIARDEWFGKLDDNDLVSL